MLGNPGYPRMANVFASLHADKQTSSFKAFEPNLVNRYTVLA
jgi:hypothetical protein